MAAKICSNFKQVFFWHCIFKQLVKKIMKILSAMGGGIAGAVALTLLHETIRRKNADAPRMDLLGIQALAKSLKTVDAPVPDEHKLFKITMAGDVLSNSLYYSIAGIADENGAILRGTLLGLAAGIGAVYLPKPLGLNPAPAARTFQTRLMTIALYLAGGVVAGVTGKLIENKSNL